MLEKREDGALTGGTHPLITLPAREGRVPSGLSSSVLTFSMELRRSTEDERNRFTCSSKAPPPPFPDLDDYKETSDLPLFLPEKKSRRRVTNPSQMLLQQGSIGDSSSRLIESTASIVAGDNFATHQSDEDHTPRKKQKTLMQFDPRILLPLGTRTIAKPIPRRIPFPGVVFRF